MISSSRRGRCARTASSRGSWPIRRGRSCRDGRPVRTSTCCSTTASCASTRCAARRPISTTGASASCSTKPGAVDRGGCTRAAGRRHRRRARAAQPLPAARRAALRLHRRRHRHHPDPADDRNGRRSRSRVAPLVRRSQPVVDGLPRRAGDLQRPGDAVAGRREGPAAARRGARRAGGRRRSSTAAGRKDCSARSRRSCASWPSGALHVERFAAKPQDEASAGAAVGFAVVCQRSGVTVTVPPDKSIIDALEENGISVLSSCLEGVCGTCETRCSKASRTIATRCSARTRKSPTST